MRIKRWWYRQWDVLFLVAYFTFFPTAGGIVGAAAGDLRVGIMGSVVALLFVGVPVLGRLARRPRFIAHRADSQGCWIDPVQAGWQLKQAYRSRPWFPGTDHDRYAAALVPGDDDGITRLVIGCWPAGENVPHIHHHEQVNVGDDLTGQLRDHIADRMISLREQAWELEQASFDQLPERLSDQRIAALIQAHRRQSRQAARRIQRQLANLTA